MSETAFVTILITLFILASGFFYLFEQAFKIVQKPRLQKEADDAARRSGGAGGAKRYCRVLTALENPDRYCTTAHFWIIILRTFAVILAGLSLGRFSAYILLPVVTAVIVLAILSLGAAIPRLIAHRSPERIVAAILPLIELFVLPLRPFLFLIQSAGKRLRRQQRMTEDDLRHALIEGEKSGIVESKERTMVEGVFYLGDKPLATFMTHRSDIQWLDINEPPQEIRAKVLEHREQHCFPVADGTLDAIIGAAYLEDIILDLSSDSPAGLRAIMKKALFAPETMPALKAFESFRQGKADFLFAMDEYGGFAGMVSVRNLMEEIVGELAAPAGEEEQAVQQEDGSWLAGGGLNIDDAEELLSLPGLAGAGDYHTIAGFVLSLAEELPRPGDSFVYQDCRFTVIDMDGNRINKIQIKKETE
ncbi:MAG: hemolysin family protein [Treponema sp.]|nr:hemolysin family protein [Treponema sp.]